MNACTGISAFELFAAASAFLAGVIWLDVYLGGIPQTLRDDDLVAALRKRSWLNALVAAGAITAAVILVLWSGSCTGGL